MAKTKLTKEQEAERLDNMLTNAADANAELEILQNAYDQAPDRDEDRKDRPDGQKNSLALKSEERETRLNSDAAVDQYNQQEHPSDSHYWDLYDAFE